MDKACWLEILHDVCPKGHEDILEGVAGMMPTYVSQLGLTSIRAQARFLGNCAVESAYFTKLEEGLKYSARRLTEVWPKRFPTLDAAKPYAMNARALANKTYGGRMGNRIGTNDGYDFRGSGILQVTGRENFTLCGFADRPDEVRTLKGALLAAGVFWSKKGCTALAEQDDIEALVRRVNGGLNALKERKDYSNRFARALAEHHDVDHDPVDHEEDDATPTMLLSAPVEVVTAVTSQTLDKPPVNEIVALQKRLSEVGYDPGRPNGDWGSMTQAALNAYQHDRGLPMTGQLDAATKAALPEAWVRPMSPERANATAQSLAEEGNAQFKSSQDAKATTVVGGGTLGVAGVIAFVKEGWRDAHDMVGQVASYLPHISPTHIAIGACGVLGLTYFKLHKAEIMAVINHRLGRVA